MMVDKALIDKYLPTIGIECHVQLKTKTKLFAAVDNDAREAEPNTLISPVCFGLPGVLPVLNEEAVKLSIRAGHALNADIMKRSVFDRKHYFYPDLPKGYQISQFHEPIVLNGHVDVPVDGEYARVGITRAHIEEDAGKLTHTSGADYSLVDLNRAGTPLLEIVSDPDIHDAKTGKAFAQELYYLMQYADVSDVDLYHGNMRFDVNISVAKKDAKELGIRSEIKNLNSFRSVERSIDYEIDRQIELLEKGERVVQETRGWDEVQQKTVAQRSKEEAHDYRYFPDPDIPPVILTDEEIEMQKKLLPQLPKQRRGRFSELDIDSSQIETLINKKHLGDVILDVSEDADAKTAKRVSNWLTVDVMRVIDEDTDLSRLDTKRLVELNEMVEDGKLNSNAASQVAVLLLSSDKSADVIAQDEGLIQVSDESQLDEIVESVLSANPKAIEDIRNGEMKAIGFLVGQVMKETKGSANPQMVQKLIKDKTSKS